MSEITVVGSKVTVDFPEYGIIGVSAKVDTGADSSALWASDIVEHDGVLSFKLFDKPSPYYTGETIELREFTITHVKNSFGHAEYRYKVTLPAVVAGHNVKVRFTLANRENNTHPILIGRRTLHGKFLVDVAAPVGHGTKRRVLMVSQRKTNSVDKFAREVEKYAKNVEMVHTDYNDLVFSFTEAGPKITLRSTGEDVDVFDMLHCKTSVQRDITAALARYAAYRGVRVLDGAVQHFPTTSKLYQYMLLADDDIRIPDSLFMLPPVLPDAYATFAEALGVPFVMKGIHASKGLHNDVVRSEAEYRQVVERAAADGVYLIGQAFVPNDSDYRVLVLGRVIPMVIKRSRAADQDTHLNNTSQGGLAILLTAADLPAHVQITSLQAAKVLDRDVAGIDMVQHSETGEWYCFEVNDGPQLATGAFTEEKRRAFAEFIETELEK